MKIQYFTFVRAIYRPQLILIFHSKTTYINLFVENGIRDSHEMLNIIQKKQIIQYNDH